MGYLGRWTPRANELLGLETPTYTEEMGYHNKLVGLAIRQMDELPYVEGHTYRKGVDPKTNQPIYVQRQDSTADPKILRVSEVREVLVGLFDEARKFLPVAWFLRDKGYISWVNNLPAVA